VTRQKRSTPRDGVVDLLADILRGVPRLENAACVGRWPGLFDPPGQGESLDHPDVAYRHRIATSICHSCDCIRDCARWVDSLPANRRPGGVVAGRLPDTGRAAA
jgi:hypothetical protein